MLPKFLVEIYRFLLDLLFPIECLRCKKEGAWICQACLRTIAPFPPGKASALKIKGCTDIFVAADYLDPLIAKSIHTMKYKMVRDLAGRLSELIIARMETREFPPESIFVPVPLHRSRQKERGFNQSELMAQALARHYKFPMVINALARIQHTKPQMSLRRAARQQNIKDAFKLIDPGLIKGKTIFLVDDVLTTGATLQECAQALAHGQPQSINAIVVAHSAK